MADFRPRNGGNRGGGFNRDRSSSGSGGYGERRGGFGGERRSFGGGSRGGFGGRDRERRPLEMHDVICDKCGKNCQVPFKPTEGKPVLCSDCFKLAGGNSRNQGGVSSDQLDKINAKLDKIIAILKDLEIVEDDLEVLDEDLESEDADEDADDDADDDSEDGEEIITDA